jgi:hypothetical protein
MEHGKISSTRTDSVATWQFDFHLVPALSIERHFRVVPVTISEEQYDLVSWWEGFDRVEDLESDLTKLLPPGHSWHPRTKTWGEQDGDRFDVTREGKTIAEVYGRLDIRRLSLPFVNQVTEIARRRGLLIVTVDRHILRPSMKELLAAIRRSRSFAFVTDPEGFLSQLANLE